MWMRSTFFLLCLLGGVSPATELLDRMVANVNGHVILLSDWEDELRFESFMSGRDPAAISPDERKGALERLIDQELLREQMRLTDEKAVDPARVQKQVESVKADYLREHGGESWDAALARYHLSEKSLEERIGSELQQAQLIDTRFRPSVQISPADIESYYKEQLVPKLPVGDPVGLAEATPKIREILVESKINQMLSSWLETLRSQAQIRIVSRDSDKGPASEGTTQ